MRRRAPCRYHPIQRSVIPNPALRVRNPSFFRWGEDGFRAPLGLTREKVRPLVPGLLPDNFQRHLNLAGRCLRGSHEPRARYGLAALVKRLQVVGWRSKVRAVQYIEKLGPELHVEAFRNSLYIVVFENREVQLCKPRTDERVAAKISGQVRAIDSAAGRRRGRPGKWHALGGKRTRCRGKRETLRLDVVIWVPGIRESLATRAAYNTRQLARLFEFHAARIAAKDRRKRLSRAYLVKPD